jgi:hypothetical protein
MSIRIGWSLTRPKERKPGRNAGGLQIFELIRVHNDGHGRHVALGVVNYRREDLERLRAKGRKLDVTVVGVLRFASNIDRDLFAATIGRRTVVGLEMLPRPLRDGS